MNLRQLLLALVVVAAVVACGQRYTAYPTFTSSPFHPTLQPLVTPSPLIPGLEVRIKRPHDRCPPSCSVPFVPVLPAFVQFACVQADNPATVTVSLSATPAPSNSVIVFAENNGDTGGHAILYNAPSASWQFIDADVTHAGFGYESWYEVASPGDTGIYTFTPRTPVRHHQICAMEFHGTSTTPIDGGGHGFLQFNSVTSWTTNTVTPAHQNELPVAMFMPQLPSVTWTNNNFWAQQIFTPTLTWSEQMITGFLVSSAINETSTSSATNTGDSAIMLLCTGSCPTISPSPTPSPSPSPTPTATPTPPITIPAYAYASETGTGCGGGSQGLEPGSAADQALFFGLESCQTNDRASATFTNNCPGHASSLCQAYAYHDQLLNFCGDSVQGGALATESHMLHTYPNAIAIANRSLKTATSQCGSYTGGSNTTEPYMNPGDPDYNTYLYNNLWSSTTFFPFTWGDFADDGQIGYDGQISNSTEYGNGTEFQAPTGPFGETFTGEEGYARFVNGACKVGGVCLHMVFNLLPNPGNANNADCVTLNGGHCYGSTSFGQGILDNQYHLDFFCAALTGANLDGLLTEHLIYDAGNRVFSSPYVLTTWLNTIADLRDEHTSDNCANTKFIQVEEPSIPAPASPAPAGVRSTSDALQWMAPDRNGYPDMIVPWNVSAGQSATEVSYWPEWEIVPVGPEQNISQYTFNGSVLSDGTFCASTGTPNGNGDTGGVQALVVTCNGAGHPVLRIQYHHCYYLGADTGPCAALINTGTSAITVASAWFTGDAASTYTNIITETGFEETVVKLPSGNITLPCTNATYCNGTLSFGATAFTAGTTSLPANSGMLLTANAPTSSAYTYGGCTIFTANDWLDTILNTGTHPSSYATDTIAPTSGNITANIASAFPNLGLGGNVDATLEATNIATTSSFVQNQLVKSNAGGTCCTFGPMFDPYHLNAGVTIPITNPFYEEGATIPGNCGGDCHVQVLVSGNSVPAGLRSCVEYETYRSGSSWSGSGNYTAEAFVVYDLTKSLNTQIGCCTGQEANTPMMGATDWGEDLAYQQVACQPNCTIPHSVGFLLAGQGTAMKGGTAPSASSASCSSACTHALPLGARLRLKASGCSFSSTCACPSPATNPQANLLCNQMKTYGMMFTDNTSVNTLMGIRLGRSSNGSNPWNSTDYNVLLNEVRITDFDVMTMNSCSGCSL